MFRPRIRLESAVLMLPQRRLGSRRWVARVTARAAGKELWDLDGKACRTARGARRDLPRVRECAVHAARALYPGAIVWGDSAWFADAQAALRNQLPQEAPRV